MPEQLDCFEPENKCHNCVFMKLELVPQQKRINFNSHVDFLDLYITLNFGWQDLEMLMGTVRFGITRGTLMLKLSNCISPYEDRSFLRDLEIKFPVQTERESIKSEQSSHQLSVSMKEVDSRFVNSGQRRRGEKIKFTSDAYQIFSKGNESYPSWDFEVNDNTSDNCLLGGITKQRLARLEVTGSPSIIEAHFITPKRKLFIEGVNGMIPKKITENRRAMIEDSIIQRIVYPKYFENFASKQILRYE